MSDFYDEAAARQRGFDKAMDEAKPWIIELVQAVAELTTAMGPLTWRIYGETAPVPDSNEYQVEHWTLYIYEGLTEFMGGKHDGAHTFSGISVNLSAVCDLLEPDIGPPQIEFSSEFHVREGGSPVISMCGKYKDNPLTLSILVEPPNDEDEPTMRLYQDGSMEMLGSDDDFEDE